MNKNHTGCFRLDAGDFNDLRKNPSFTQGDWFAAGLSGHAAISCVSPQRLTHDSAVPAVCRNDNATHVEQCGEIGMTAHHRIDAHSPA